MENNSNFPINWEKIGVYVAILVGFLTMMFYIIDMKVDIAKLQVHMENISDKKDKK